MELQDNNKLFLCTTRNEMAINLAPKCSYYADKNIYNYNFFFTINLISPFHIFTLKF